MSALTVLTSIDQTGGRHRRLVNLDMIMSGQEVIFGDTTGTLLEMDDGTQIAVVEGMNTIITRQPQ